MNTRTSSIAVVLTFASAFSTSSALAAAVPARDLTRSLEQDIARRKNADFSGTLHQWSETHGAKAVAPLLKIASDPKKEDHDRYVALMGAAKLAGPQGAVLFEPFLKDRSWMLRSGALRVLASFGAASKTAGTGASVLPLLRDPALVVRSEAVTAAVRLHPPGTAEALVELLNDSSNYQAGKAHWTARKALAALASFDGEAERRRGLAKRLLPVLEYRKDPAFLKQAVVTLEKLHGKSLKPGAKLSERVGAWKNELGAKSKL